MAFAVTNRHGWCVNRRRYFAGNDVRVNISFWLFPMPQSPACGWLSLGELKRVEKDGWILCHALCKIGVAPWSCRELVFLAYLSLYCTESVYPEHLILLVALYQYGTSKIEYAAKVVRSDWENYSREVVSFKSQKLIHPFTQLATSTQGAKTFVLIHPPVGRRVLLFRHHR